MTSILGPPQTDAQNDIQLLLHKHGLEYTPDGGLIRWSASNSQHPRNWSIARKFYDTSLIIFLDLFVCVSEHLEYPLYITD